MTIMRANKLYWNSLFAEEKQKQNVEANAIYQPIYRFTINYYCIEFFPIQRLLKMALNKRWMRFALFHIQTHCRLLLTVEINDEFKFGIQTRCETLIQMRDFAFTESVSYLWTWDLNCYCTTKYDSKLIQNASQSFQYTVHLPFAVQSIVVVIGYSFDQFAVVYAHYLYILICIERMHDYEYK